jgi:hypothetical protein
VRVRLKVSVTRVYNRKCVCNKECMVHSLHHSLLMACEA